MTELSDRVWRQVHRRMGRSLPGPKAPEPQDGFHVAALVDGEGSFDEFGGYGVAHSDIEYLPASRGAAVVVLAAFQGVLFLTLVMMPIFEQHAH
eukprot:3338557-Prymnesium_polylepis.1